jgi:hypothetical protein
MNGNAFALRSNSRSAITAMAEAKSVRLEISDSQHQVTWYLEPLEARALALFLLEAAKTVEPQA